MPSKTNGLIRLQIKRDHQFIICEIRDNGVGILHSKANKSAFGNHHSKGMEILRKRIDSINQLYSCKVSMDIEDISKLHPAETGTSIVIRFPFELVSKSIFKEP